MTLQNVITFDLLSYYDGKIKAWVKALTPSTENNGLMTKDQADKLAAIEASADVNVIETVKVDGSALTPDSNKAVNIDLSGKADKVASATDGHFAGLDSNGNLTDSGKAAADFATATQGGYADSALQSISAGTDGSYVTTTIGTKSGDAGAKSQTVATAVTVQAMATADASHMGLAEASDVKAYVANLVSAGVNYKGSVNTYSDLPNDASAGDMYNVKNDSTISSVFYPGDMNYIWAGAVGTQGQESYVAAHWDPQSPTIVVETASTSQIDVLFA